MHDLESRIAATKPSASSITPLSSAVIVARARRRQAVHRVGAALTAIALLTVAGPSVLEALRPPDVALLSPGSEADASEGEGADPQAKWTLPDRTSPAVLREEARLGKLVARSGKVVDAEGARCEVRLLGNDGETSYVWARCMNDKGSVSGVSLPMRVDGRSLSLPQDGTDHAESIRRLFPPALAEAILTDRARLKP